MRMREVIVAIVCLAWATSANATLEVVEEPFAAADYSAAADRFAGSEDGARPAEAELWQARFQKDPDRALEVLEKAFTADNIPAAVQVRLGLEIARLAAARGDNGNALHTTRQLLMRQEGDLPGEVYLLAGRASRALGDLQGAREMLASIRPDDPAFVAGRGLLGEIGLQQNDPTLALRYFESAVDREPGAGTTELGAGLWQALRRTGEHQRADGLLADLEENHPGSLALLRIRRILRLEQEELAARAVEHTAPVDSVVARTEDRTGRFSLQLGAFSDRGLALEFLDRYENQIEDLRIETVRDDRAQTLYKIRAGSFVNPARAQTEAKRLQRSLGIEVIVTDLAN